MTTTDDGAQPRCDRCGVLMRDIPGGWKCPACGHTLLPTMPVDVQMPPPFDGPSVWGG